MGHYRGSNGRKCHKKTLGFLTKEMLCRVSACIRLAKQTKTDVGRVARKEEDWCWLPGYTMGTGLLPGSVQVAEWQHLLHALLGSSLHGEKQRACCRLGPRCLL